MSARPHGLGGAALIGAGLAVLATASLLLMRLTISTVDSVLGSLAPPVYLVPVITAIGGLAVGVLARVSGGLGVMPERFQFLVSGRPPRLLEGIMGAVLSTLTISSGGFAGREEPAAALASAVGRRLQRWHSFQLVSSRGLTAAIVLATVTISFGAPFAGLAFAVERGARTMTRIDGATLFGALIAGSVLGRWLAAGPILPPGITPPSTEGWVGLLITAVGAACVGLLYLSGLGLAVEARHRLRGTVVAPAFGGLIAGILIVSLPAIGLGPVVDRVRPLLVPAEASLPGAASQLLASIATIGLGGWGGLLAPVLGIGSTFGMSVASLFPIGLGESGGPTLALAGTLVLLTVVLRAPLTGLALAYEVGSDAGFLFAAALLVLVTHQLVRRLDPASAYRLLGFADGFDTSGGLVRDPSFNTTRVVDLLDRAIVSVSPSLAADAVLHIPQAETEDVLVLTESGRCWGLVRWQDVTGAVLEGRSVTTVADIARRGIPLALPYATLAEVYEQPGAAELSIIPVIDPARGDRVIGVLRHDNVSVLLGLRTSRGSDEADQ